MYTYLTKFLKRVFQTPEQSFVVLAVFFGIAAIVLMPPFTGADEESHFVRAYGISQGILVVGGDIEMPTSFRETLGCMQHKEPISGEIYTYTYKSYGESKIIAFKCALSLGLNQSDTEPIPTTAPGYAPATYIPQVLAILIGRVFDAPVILIAYLVRIATLAAYTALIFIAIRVLPVRKWALVGVGLLPISIIQVTNPGGDYMILSAIAIFIAVIVRSLVRVGGDSVSKRTLIALGTAAAIFMVLPKGIFPGICFLPLIFFFGGLRGRYISKTIAFVAIGAIGLIWQKFGVPYSIGVTDTGDSSVFNFPYALIKTMFYGWTDGDFMYQGIGFGLGEDIAGMPSLAVSFMTLLTGMYLFVSYSTDKLKFVVSSAQMKIFTTACIFVAGLVVIGSFAAMHITGAYLQDGSGVIKGVQPRYFYPALFMLAAVPFSRIIHTKQRSFIIITLVGSIVLLTVQSLSIAMQYQWGIF